MKTKEKTTNVADLKAVPFQMKKTLIPIDRYAQKESLSRDIVDQCAKMGLLQIRKCRGEVFVVDTPFDAFGPRNEILADINSQIAQQIPVAAPKKQTPKQKVVKTTKPVAKTKPATTTKKEVAPPVKKRIKTPNPSQNITGRITEKPLPKNTSKPAKTLGFEDDEPIEIDEIINTEILSNASTKVKPEDFGLDISEVDELLNEKDLLLDYQDSYHKKKNKVIVSQKNWTTAAIISALCLSFSLMCCFWLYLDSQMQRDKLRNLRMDNVRLQKNLTTAKTQTAGIREEFTASNRKISELNNQISNLKMELANTKNRLELTTRQLEQATKNTQ